MDWLFEEYPELKVLVKEKPHGRFVHVDDNNYQTVVVWEKHKIALVTADPIEKKK